MAGGESGAFERLQRGIVYRQTELHRVADILAREARRLRRRGATLRVLLIVLGAIISAQASFGHFITDERASGAIFAVIGVAVSVIAGIETAFRFEKRGTELNALAAACHSLARETDTAWQRMVLVEEDRAVRQRSALELLNLQDETLQEVQSKAAAAGINIAQQVREDDRAYGEPAEAMFCSFDLDREWDPQRIYPA